MGTWKLSADLLARSRFTVSPWQEALGALATLSLDDRRVREPWAKAFRAGHREAFVRMLADHPVRRALQPWLVRPRQGRRPGWVADFICPAPPHVNPTFEDERAALSTWTDEDVRRELTWMHGADLPPSLLEHPLRDEALELLTWVWTATVSADWPRRKRILEADIVSRTSRLATKGWAAVIDDLRPTSRWLGDGELQLNGFDLPTRDLTRARDLFFVPATHVGVMMGQTAPDVFALVYPVTGALAPPASDSDQGLGRLIGGNRARVLHALDTPRSTTQLAAITGLPIGSVGNHLRVLLDAGIVLRRRSGREVLYWRTSLGDGLCAAGG